MDDLHQQLVRSAQLETELRFVKEQLAQANNANQYLLTRLSNSDATHTRSGLESRLERALEENANLKAMLRLGQRRRLPVFRDPFTKHSKALKDRHASISSSQESLVDVSEAENDDLLGLEAEEHVSEKAITTIPEADVPEAASPRLNSRIPFSHLEHNRMLGMAVFLEDDSKQARYVKWNDLSRNYGGRPAHEYEKYYQSTIRPAYQKQKEHIAAGSKSAQIVTHQPDPIIPLKDIEAKETPDTSPSTTEPNQQEDISMSNVSPALNHYEETHLIDASDAQNVPATPNLTTQPSDSPNIKTHEAARFSKYDSVLSSFTETPVETTPTTTDDEDDVGVEGSTPQLSRPRSSEKLTDPNESNENFDTPQGLSASMHADRSTAAGAPLNPAHEVNTSTTHLSTSDEELEGRLRHAPRGPKNSSASSPSKYNADHPFRRPFRVYGPQGVSDLFQKYKPGDPHKFRTVVISGIPPDVSRTEIMAAVRGDRIVKVNFCETVDFRSDPPMDANTAKVTFFNGFKARDFMKYCEDHPITFPSSTEQNPVTVTLINSRKTSDWLFKQIFEYGASRVIYLHNPINKPRPDDVLASIHEATRRNMGADPAGFVQAAMPLQYGYDSDGILSFEYASVLEAETARKAVMRRQDLFPSVQVGYLPDPCDKPLPKGPLDGEEELEGDEVGDPEIGIDGAEDDEIEGGADSESKYEHELFEGKADLVREEEAMMAEG